MVDTKSNFLPSKADGIIHVFSFVEYHQCCADVLVIAAVFQRRMLQGTRSLIH